MSAPTPEVAINVLKNVAQVTTRLVDGAAGLETALPVDGPLDGSRYWSVDAGWSANRILETCSEGGAQQALLLTLVGARGDPGGYALELRRIHERGLDEILGAVQVPAIPPGATGITREQFEALREELGSLVERAAETPGQLDVLCTDSQSKASVACSCDLDGVGTDQGSRCSFRTISGSYNLTIGGGDSYAPSSRLIEIGEGEVVGHSAQDYSAEIEGFGRAGRRSARGL
jgi:hypothetical protein